MADDTIHGSLAGNDRTYSRYCSFSPGLLGSANPRPRASEYQVESRIWVAQRLLWQNKLALKIDRAPQSGSSCLFFFFFSWST